MGIKAASCGVPGGKGVCAQEALERSLASVFAEVRG